MRLNRFTPRLQLLALLLTATLITCIAVRAEADEVVESAEHHFRVVELADGLSHPWGMAFLPDGGILITERAGRLRLYSRGELSVVPMIGFPEIRARGQGGLLDVTLHPDFKDNKWVYFTHSLPDSLFNATTAVVRARFDPAGLRDFETIFTAKTDSGTSHHFGSRLLFDHEGYLFVTVGDRGQREKAQRLDYHAGKVLRLTAEGETAPGNPFIGRKDALPEIYSYGHRNPQGLALHPDSGEPWLSEHGPKGGDEINRIEPGINYGWPVITYGQEYIGGKIGIGTHHPDMAQPLHQWTPSIAPAGITFYSGDAFPGWRGDLFVAALKYQLLVRLDLEGESIHAEERLLKEKIGRIRTVREGPDGLLYLLTDEAHGALYRLEPVQ